MLGCIPVTLVITIGALNGSQKLRGLCKPHLQMSKRKPGTLVSGAAIAKRRQRLKWANTCRKSGFTPDYTAWTFHGESAQRDRAEVDHRRTDKHGTRMENMVQDYDDARDSDKEMEEYRQGTFWYIVRHRWEVKG